jgi:hypothetical protein
MYPALHGAEWLINASQFRCRLIIMHVLCIAGNLVGLLFAGVKQYTVLGGLCSFLTVDYCSGV